MDWNFYILQISSRENWGGFVFPPLLANRSHISLSGDVNLWKYLNAIANFQLYHVYLPPYWKSLSGDVDLWKYLNVLANFQLCHFYVIATILKTNHVIGSTPVIKSRNILFTLIYCQSTRPCVIDITAMTFIHHVNW